MKLLRLGILISLPFMFRLIILNRAFIPYTFFKVMDHSSFHEIFYPCMLTFPYSFADIIYYGNKPTLSSRKNYYKKV